MKQKRKLITALITLVTLGAITAGAVYYILFTPAFNLRARTYYIYIRPGDTPETVYRQLETQTAPGRMAAFRRLASFYDYDTRIRSGRYEVRNDDNLFHFFRRLSTGQQTPTRLTIPSVRTIERLASSIAAQIMLDSTSIATTLKDSTACARLGYTPQTIACLFLPNTYEVYWNMDAEAFFTRMQKEYNRFWNETRRQKAKALNLTPQEITILASIIDEETTQNDEKPTIAGLYLNRLQRGMLLQADPTVKYANGDFTLKRILFKHLDVNSPYNTYKYAGLPPGPIRIPSIAGIESVLNYQKHNYLYMCAREDFSGYHNFASTLAQHNANAARYQRELNRRNIK